MGSVNVDRILRALNRRRVSYLLVGGMNYLLRHKPVLTYDVDVWVEDSPANLRRCERALAALKAEWGPTVKAWKPVAHYAAGWLERQQVFCLTSPSGAIDIFRAIRGLGAWRSSRARAVRCTTPAGISCWALSDRDLLRSQAAVPRAERKPERIRDLRRALASRRKGRG